MLTVLGGLAEFERDLIRTRTGEGRERAKARGVRLGRKPKLTENQKREAIRRRDRDGEPVREIARTYNVSHSTMTHPLNRDTPAVAMTATDRRRPDCRSILLPRRAGSTARRQLMFDIIGAAHDSESRLPTAVNTRCKARSTTTRLAH
jgi:hypothetical protein